MTTSPLIGEALRAARQKRRLTASQVAEITRLKLTAIEDLERSDFSRVPAPIYGRGFIKLYAEAVGIDPKPLVDHYMHELAVARPPTLQTDLPPPAGRRPVTRSMRRNDWARVWNTFRRNLERAGADLRDRLRAPPRYRTRAARPLGSRFRSLPWAALVVVAGVILLLVFIALGLSQLFATARTAHVHPPAARAARATEAPLRLAEEPPAPYPPPAPAAPVAR